MVNINVIKFNKNSTCAKTPSRKSDHLYKVDVVQKCLQAEMSLRARVSLRAY